MKLVGLYGTKPKETQKEEEVYLRLVKLSDCIELQAVNEKGTIEDAGHLMRFEVQIDGKVKADAYTSVSAKLPFVCGTDGRLKIGSI